MRTRVALVVVCILAVMLLAGCQWWTTSAGTTGPGASWMVVNPGAEATAAAGALRWQIQLTAQAEK